MARARSASLARRRSAARFPLLELFEWARSSADAAPDIAAAAASVGLPVPTVRGVLSFYSDLHRADSYPLICRGTSCMLEGGEELSQRLGASRSTRAAYCLGYCHRSPAALLGEEEPRCGLDVRDELPTRTRECAQVGEQSPPPVRCLASDPIVTRRIGRGDFSDLSRAREDGAYRVLERFLAREPTSVIDELERSRERGRGGAAFPTGAKWRHCAQTVAGSRYVVANGDEGDPGSFLDRVLMEYDPHAVLEGLILCAWAVGAGEGIVFVRSEYPRARLRMQRAIEQAREAGILGPSVLGSEFAFDVVLFRGLGSYVCGEETAMLNAIEGLRGEVRLRPPYPTTEGLFGAPTVVNNVETLANVPVILERGADAYSALGTNACAGTKALCLNRGFERPGIVEVEFGIPLRRVIEEAGGGRGGAPLEAVLVGGPMGSVAFPEEWDVPVCYAAMGSRGMQLGHGGLVAVRTGADWRGLLVHWLRFTQEESCGKCVPCALGSRRALQLSAEIGAPESRKRLDEVLTLMQDASLCAFGRLVPAPVRRVLARIDDLGGTGARAR